MDEYTTEFYQLIAKNELQETEDQLAARYISGLRAHIQDTVNMLDPVSVSTAHQRALMIERKSFRHTGSVVQNFGIGSISSGTGSGVFNKGTG